MDKAHFWFWMARALRDLSNSQYENAGESTSTTEEIMSTEGMESELLQEWCAETTREWLALHGSRLFSLETSKFLAAESKRSNLKSGKIAK